MKKRISRILLGIIAGSAIIQAADAETLSFSQVWNQIKTQSKALESAELMTQSAEQGKNRSQRHWLPKLYLDVKTYRTNEAAASFVGLLEQKSVQNSDFATDSLNNPETLNYTRSAIGIDWPLYEGGMKNSFSKIESSRFNAQVSSAKQVEVDQYSVVASSYSSIAIIETQKKKLTELQSLIQKLVKSYQLGAKANPVGYSGLLGMKSLQNRVEGLLNQYESQSKSYQLALKEMGLSVEAWSPEFIEADKFVQTYLLTEKADEAGSYKIQALKENSKMSELAAKMEKARYLPRVGAFAEAQAFKGDRDTGNGYMAGLYLQWSLFNATDLGAYKEAKLKSQSMAKFAEASEQQDRAEQKGFVEATDSLKFNLNLVNESEKLMIEQTKVAEQLFKNGSINALQFVEVLNRRTDLVYQQSEIQLNLIKTASSAIKYAAFDLSKIGSLK